MKRAAVALAALMGFSRLYVGVHFPSDVLAGLCVGLLSSALAWLLWRRFTAWRDWSGKTDHSGGAPPCNGMVRSYFSYSGH